jgi:hypothetical protein
MQTAEENGLYVPRKRIQVGKFRFVEINPNPKIPIFRCCPNHDGDPDYCIPYLSNVVSYHILLNS